VLAIGMVVYGLLAVLTAVGSWHRQVSLAYAVAEGLAWPVSWVRWYVVDNRAAGRRLFEGHAR
jgi:hypothetical protein